MDIPKRVPGVIVIPFLILLIELKLKGIELPYSIVRRAEFHSCANTETELIKISTETIVCLQDRRITWSVF